MARALGKDPIFVEGYGESPQQRDKNLIFFIFFAFHQYKHYIYIYKPSHMYITHNPISYNISQP